MHKIKMSKKQKKCGSILLKEHIPYKNKMLVDSQLVIEVLFDCIRENDLETFRDVLFSHIKTLNKVEFSKRAKIGRRTLYDILDLERDFNPSLSTVAAVIHAIESEKEVA